MRRTLLSGIFAAAVIAASPAAAQEASSQEASGPEALAQESAATRSAIICRPVKAVVKFLKKIEDIAPESRSIVDTVMSVQIKALDGKDMPKRIYVSVGDQETPLTLDPAGYIEGFSRLSGMPEETQFCIEDPARAGTPLSSPGLNVHMSSSTQYLAADGRHDIATLLLGGKHGKTHYKKTMGGGIKNAFIPRIDHVLVSPVGGKALPEVSVLRGDVAVDVAIEEVGYGPARFHVISLKDMKKAGAESLRITGGYTLKPVPSVKKLRKFGLID